MNERAWNVYLSGEIHSEWRERIEAGVREAGLAITFSAPVTDHATSDSAGSVTLGGEEEPFWRDHMGAGVNAIRTQTLIRAADVVVVRFGDQYRQWNAAFDAGYAAALGKPILTLHDRELDHPLQGGRPRRPGHSAHGGAGRRSPSLRDRRRVDLGGSVLPVYEHLFVCDGTSRGLTMICACRELATARPCVPLLLRRRWG